MNDDEKNHHQFTCAVCGQTFCSLRPEREIMEEFKRLYGERGYEPETDKRICESCWVALGMDRLVV